MSQLWEIGLSPLAQCIVIPSTVAHELNTPIGNCCSEPNTLSARHCHKHAELHRIARQITSRREGGSAWSDLARHVFSRPVHWLMLVVRWRLRPSLQRTAAVAAGFSSLASAASAVIEVVATKARKSAEIAACVFMMFSNIA
jgi:hypothetical protein